MIFGKCSQVARYASRVKVYSNGNNKKAERLCEQPLFIIYFSLRLEFAPRNQEPRNHQTSTLQQVRLS